MGFDNLPGRVAAGREVLPGPREIDVAVRGAEVAHHQHALAAARGAARRSNSARQESSSNGARLLSRCVPSGKQALTTDR